MEISSSGSGANGIIATGESSAVTASNLTISAAGDVAHGVMATLGGAITLTDVEITTSSRSSAPLATDQGSGTVSASGGTYVSTRDWSPGIYADVVSTLSISLASGSLWTGALNPDGSASAASVTIDAESSWELTVDSILTTLTDEDGIEGTTVTNITCIGFSLSYDVGAYPDLAGGTYELVGGGTLSPLG